MKWNSAKKMSYTANTFILIFVLVMMLLFVRFDTTILIYLSYPAIIVYLVGYFLIYKDKLFEYIWMVYIWIILYMSVTTICLGTNYGFHLYSMSMIPIIYITNYLAYQLDAKEINAFAISILVGAFYLASVIFSTINGPIYETNKTVNVVFLFCNSATVLIFLIGYTDMLVKLVIKSEEKLKVMAHIDKLTGVYNRHYTLGYMESLISKEQAGWMAMVDIDNFKNINDTYGHDCGDYVLVHLCDIMKLFSDKWTVSRWGGEEFIILANSDEFDFDLFEKLRSKVSEESFCYGEHTINITVTIGLSKYDKGKSINDWINEADKNLYYGKNNGKNRVVMS